VQVPEPTIFGASDVASLSHAPAVSLLTALDVDGDSAASRRDMLLAFRRDRQLAGDYVHAWQLWQVDPELRHGSTVWTLLGAGW